MTASTPRTLAPTRLDPLPLGAIRPAGWLLDTLRTQADGMSGHLDEFWPDIADSGWIGGDREGWERGPYWLDGLVPLAFLLEDDRLIGKVCRWVDYILDGQHADGWLGPTYHRYPDPPAILPPAARTHSPLEFEPWPQAILAKALIQFHEATGDERVIPALTRLYAKIADLITTQPLESWARFRWMEFLVGIHWLFERTGDTTLLRLAVQLREQGFDWTAHYSDFPYRERLTEEQCDLPGHGPNNAMAIKAPAVWSRQSHDPADLAFADRIIDELDRYHGQATGMFTSDEHLAGRSPSQGAELCAVVEYLYALEQLISIGGRPDHVDRWERLAYNALSAPFSPDMWTHQYDQQVNQVACHVVEDRIYTSNGPDANLYGLEPHFGCCTANMHQGWPKVATHLWMRTRDGGLAAIGWAPCVVETSIDGGPVRVSVATDYPFDETITITIDGPATGMPLDLRIPGWATGATVRMNHGDPIAAAPGTFHRVTVTGPCRITLHLPMPVRAERRSPGSVALYSGPLLLAHAPASRWDKIIARETVDDWAVLPTAPWNYALVPVDWSALPVRRTATVPGTSPWSRDDAPVRVMVPARRLSSWEMVRGAAGPIPECPVEDDSPEELIELLPFGCTDIRVGEFPFSNSNPSRLIRTRVNV
ncbi:MAG TPA: beta-L-arabinofuranosidase domain-containing protein [Thermomicrobiales bacterium]|jgi:DUF1680 family protein|nr:beta-L-arabinofuranosidase domain-containing protein [Thermomicrobiales bacterium]